MSDKKKKVEYTGANGALIYGGITSKKLLEAHNNRVKEAAVDHYILDQDGCAIPVDALTWAKWFKKNDSKRRLEHTKLGLVSISTVFLGLKHGFDHDGSPLLWETLVSTDCDRDQEMHRYVSAGDARQKHWELVDQLIGLGNVK